MSYSRFFISALSSLCILSNVAFAQAPTPADDDNAPITRAQLPALIKKALLNDPLILTEVIEKMQSSQDAEIAAKSKDAIIKRKNDLYSDPTSPSVGAADADITIVEFFDYHCGYCKQALASISKLLENDKKVRVVFKEYPILSEDSKFASRAALAVNRIAKDKYFDFHKAMFAVNGNIDEKLVLDRAKSLGIDTEKLKKELSNPALEASLSKNRELGAEIGAQGTPAFVIGDNLYPGAMPYESIQKAIDAARKANKKPAGK